MGRNQRQLPEGDLTQGDTENRSSSSEPMGFSHPCLERCRYSLTRDWQCHKCPQQHHQSPVREHQQPLSSKLHQLCPKLFPTLKS